MNKILYLFLLLFITTPLFSQEKLHPALSAHLVKTQKSPELIQLWVSGDKLQITSWLNNHHGFYKYSSGNFHAIGISSADIRVFSSQPFVKSIYFENYQPRMMNDTMRVRVNVDSAQAGAAPLDISYKGNGVISAVIDTGIDFMHPDLQDANGKTRVLAIWDQTAAYDAQRTPPYGYGQVWDSTDINAGNCTEFDPTGYGGHGTTVIGTASGNGLATGNHRGVAPESSILFVKNPLSGANWTATIADAIDWIFHVADSLDMPVSINLSLGEYEGSHDGNDPSSRYVDSLIRAKRGRLVCAAGGNSGDASLYGNYHLETQVTTDTSFTWFTYNASSALGFGAVYFEVYADTAQFNQVQFAIGADATSPGYLFRGRTAFHNIQNMINTNVYDTIWNAGNNIGSVNFYGEEYNGLYRLTVLMQQPDSNQYNFRLMTTGSGSFDVWSASWMGISDMVGATDIPSATQFPDISAYVTPDSAKVIVSGLQCLSSVVTVANFNNKNAYWDYTHTLQTFPIAVGQISVNSSRGPTRDNRMKPDIAASGDPTMSCSPLALLAYQTVNEPYKVDQDGMHTRNGGTSIASPVVSGIGVLLLERCPDMSWDEFRQYISASANTDNFTGNVPNITWGHGKINAFRALLETKKAPEILGGNVICPGDSLLLSGGNNLSYYWNTGETSSSIYADTAGDYTLSVTHLGNCPTDTATIQVVNAVPQFPAIDGYINGNPFYCWSATTGIKTWYNIPGAGGDQLLGSGDTISFNPFAVTSDSYLDIYFVLTDSSGCSYHSDTLLFILGGMENINLNDKVKIFPNPANDQVTVASNESAISSISVYTINGKKVWQKNCNAVKIVNTDVNLSPGIYLVEVLLENNQKVRQKLLISR